MSRTRLKLKKTTAIENFSGKIRHSLPKRNSSRLNMTTPAVLMALERTLNFSKRSSNQTRMLTTLSPTSWKGFQQLIRKSRQSLTKEIEWVASEIATLQYLFQIKKSQAENAIASLNFSLYHFQSLDIVPSNFSSFCFVITISHFCF